LKSELYCFFSLKPDSTVFPPYCRSNSRFGVAKSLWESRSTFTFKNVGRHLPASAPDQKVPDHLLFWQMNSRNTLPRGPRIWPRSTQFALDSLKHKSDLVLGNTTTPPLIASMKAADSSPFKISRASSLDRVMFSSRQELGRRESLCLTRRCDA
jgi:hypothetical protein